jgi:hypothetical protein
MHTLSHKLHLTICPSQWSNNYFSPIIGVCVPLTLLANRFMSLKCKAIPLQVLAGLRVPGGWGSQISRQSAHEGGKIVSRTHRSPLPQGNNPVLISVRGWITQGPQCGRKDYVNEKFQWHHRKSNPRPQVYISNEENYLDNVTNFLFLHC